MLFLVLFSRASFGQLEAWGDTIICLGGQAQLNAAGEGASYFWTSYPTDPSLLIPQQQNPVVSPQVNTMYVVQSNIATGNLILNGTFEMGVTGFFSEYVNNQVSIVDEGTYAVVNDAHTVHPNFFCNEDHTSGSGKFMAVNGAGVANVKVWYFTLNNIQPNRRYEFSTWITSLHATNPAILQFSINGVLMGNPFQAYPYTCDWYQFFHLWDSEENTQATISIVNQNTILSGNDFALDDISFATVLVYYDTVYVDVLPVFNSPFEAPSTACTDELVTVIYTGNAPDTADFHWDFGSAAVISGSGPGPYEIVHNTIGNNTLSLYVDGPGCASEITEHIIAVGESPDVTATADDAILPYGSATTLHGTYSGGLGPYVFEWSHPELLLDPLSLDPQTVALQFTTEFILSVTDGSGGCTGHDTVVVEVAGGPLGVSVSADPEEICPGGQSILTAQGLGGTESYTYAWTSNPPGFSSTLQEVTVQPAVTTEYTVTVNDGLSETSSALPVIVNQPPDSYAGSNQTIPFGTVAILQGTGMGGSGSYNYRWEPAEMVLNPNSSATETVILEGTTIFTLTVTDQVTGCVGLADEMMVEVTGGPLAVIINSDKPYLCEGETAVLTAYPSGGNVGGYGYTWTDNLGNSYPSTQEITVSPASTLTFKVTVFDGFTTTEAYKMLEVYPSMEFSWPGDARVVFACPLDSLVLQPANQPSPDCSFLWSNGSVTDHITVGVTGIGFSLDTYSLTISSEEGCSYTDSVTVIFDFAYCSGISSRQAVAPVLISPNPSRGVFLVTFPAKNDFKRISVYNSISGLVFDEEIPDNPEQVAIDLTDHPDGIYFLILAGMNGMISGKMLISR